MLYKILRIFVLVCAVPQAFGAAEAPKATEEEAKIIRYRHESDGCVTVTTVIRYAERTVVLRRRFDPLHGPSTNVTEVINHMTGKRDSYTTRRHQMSDLEEKLCPPSSRGLIHVKYAEL